MKYRIGIDLGGTNIAAGIVDENNKIVGFASVPTALPRTAELIADSIKEAALAALDNANNDCNITLADIVSLGIGTPGAVNAQGVIEFSSNLGFNNTPLKAMLEERLELPVFIDNDANCAALGEQMAGCGESAENFIAVTLGTGIGGGIIVGGKLITGVNGAAGEIGHMVIEHDGIVCPCGRIGCFEQYASATALVRQAKDALIRDRDHESKMWKLIDGDIEKVDGKVVFDAAHDDDSIALKVLDHFTEWLSCGVANLINIFQPEVLCVGGGISKQGDFIIDPLIKKVEKKRYTKHSEQQTRICAATLGNDAGIIGAALLGS